MPNLDQKLINELKSKLENIIASKPGYHSPSYLDSGGSAAVFKVETPNGIRAFKVFDPKFINDEENSKERHRLSLQERLINHSCETLVQTYDIILAEETAFVEMEFIEWPQLKKNIRHVPDDAIQPLIIQLIEAVRFLESLNIVHRDIKPENIHVSSDFKKLKLLDLGVVREFDPGPDVEETDHGDFRLFLATAQYSSPEYLFRLDPPSEDLWRALNLYQVGAVLYDLIMKEAIFQAEINTGNRWLVAKAVLLKHPNFKDGSPDRLANLKAIASKCLTKDMNIRLKIVTWSDFTTSLKEPLVLLRERLSSMKTSSEANIAREINFQKEKFKEKISQEIRECLITICKTDLPFSLSNSNDDENAMIKLEFKLEKNISIHTSLKLIWLDGFYNKDCMVEMISHLTHSSRGLERITFSKNIICTYNADVNTKETSYLICSVVARLIVRVLDLVAATDIESSIKLHNLDLIMDDSGVEN
ncbi:protein kinase [Pantoea ananatis]|uniref:protein kinase domain-containing protein n=1 Tax=Pantoea ananas TaxID=553 RepID=UPI00158A6839|nr:protein kinase [Pantoea ananatis]MBA4824014.1 protein kinase [Pantoea ananatis]MCW1834793.1 protein kinase [Pantoea ananatis]QKV89771.1 protein kinase [Pantoea ananatis]